MPPLPGSPAPNAPGTGSPAAPVQASVPDPMGQHPQGARVPTGLAYGQEKQLRDAQHAMPLGGGKPGIAVPGPGAAGGIAPGGGMPGPLAPDHPSVLSAAQGFSPPALDFGRPTERPYEPVTAGISQGPGPGPEVIRQAVPDANAVPLSVLLSTVAQQSGSKAVADLAMRASAAGQ